MPGHWNVIEGDCVEQMAMMDEASVGAPREADCPRCHGTGRDPCGFGSPDPWVCMTCGNRAQEGQ